MSSNKNILPAATAAAIAATNARFQWDKLEGIRTLLFILYKRYSYWNATQYARIINTIFAPRMIEMGLPLGIDNHRVGAEWRSRKKEVVKGKWGPVRSKGNEAELRSRDRWEGIVRLVAKQLKLELREEVGEGEDDDGSDVEEDEAAEGEMTEEEYAEEAKTFREKFEEMSGAGTGGDTGAAGSA